MKNAQELAEMAEKWYKDSGKNIYTDYNTMPSFIKGYQAAQEEITTEVKRRVAIVISEPNGIVREFLIANLINL